MTTLREEIRFYLSTYYDCASYDDAVNTIFSKIEKRIDEKIEWFKSEYDGTVDPYIIIPYLKEIKELLK